MGNRTASHHSSTYSYQPFNKVVTIGTTTYSYDNNGNLTQKVDASGTWTYTWDYENRLKQVTRPDSQVITYKYDALGRRVQRSKGSDWAKYVYDGQDVVRDINSDGSTVDYLNGLGIDDKIRQTSSAGTLYFTQDHLGSARALTDNNGNVVENINYDSFGNGNSSLTRYGYTGREWDADVGLYYYRNRWYDPQSGRFISEDPIGLMGGINLFAYVENNPLSFTDPSGLDRVIGRFVDYKYDEQTDKIVPAKTYLIVKKEPEYEYNWWGAFFAAFDYYSNCRYDDDPWGRYEGVPEDRFINYLAETYSKPPSFLGGTISFIGFAQGPSAVVPQGATGPTPVRTGKGFQFTGGSGGNGLNPKVSNLRIMDPTAPKGPSPGYPKGYASYSNSQTPTPQTVNPYTGQPIPRSDPWWHIPLK